MKKQSSIHSFFGNQKRNSNPTAASPAQTKPEEETKERTSSQTEPVNKEQSPLPLPTGLCDFPSKSKSSAAAFSSSHTTSKTPKKAGAASVTEKRATSGGLSGLSKAKYVKLDGSAQNPSSQTFPEIILSSPKRSKPTVTDAVAENKHPNESKSLKQQSNLLQSSTINMEVEDSGTEELLSNVNEESIFYDDIDVKVEVKQMQFKKKEKNQPKKKKADVDSDSDFEYEQELKKYSNKSTKTPKEEEDDAELQRALKESLKEKTPNKQQKKDAKSTTTASGSKRRNTAIQSNDEEGEDDYGDDDEEEEDEREFIRSLQKSKFTRNTSDHRQMTLKEKEERIIQQVLKESLKDFKGITEQPITSQYSSGNKRLFKKIQMSSEEEGYNRPSSRKNQTEEGGEEQKRVTAMYFEEEEEVVKPTQTTSRQKTAINQTASSTKQSSKKSTQPPPDIVGGVLKGQTIVFSGEFNGISRDALCQIVTSNGGKCPGSVSGKTSILVHGSILEDGREPQSSRKYRDAKLKGVLIFDQNQFSDFIQEKIGSSLLELGEIVQGGNRFDKFESKAASAPTVLSSSAKPQSDDPPKRRGLIPVNLPKAVRVAAEAAARVSGTATEQPLPVQIQNAVAPSQNSNLWTTKHRPMSVRECVGNQVQQEKMMTWLNDWIDVVIRGKKKESKKNFFVPQVAGGENSMNVNARACLISGPPGVGKTTSVRLIAEFMGYEVREWNASDSRSKRSVNNIIGDLKDNSIIKQISAQSQAAAAAAAGKEPEPQVKSNRKFIILMDEVDGMSSGDRGGNQALIDAIKLTNVPIFCICNDRMLPKVRSLSNYCYDVKFVKPPKQDIAKHLLKILNKEGFRNVEVEALEDMSQRFNCDIRQTLSFLEMHFKNRSQLLMSDMNRVSERGQKDITVMMDAYDASLQLMQSFQFQKLSLRERSELFFVDYDLIPLLVQQNYLDTIVVDDEKMEEQINKQGKKVKKVVKVGRDFSMLELSNVVTAAAAIAESDILSAKIRTNGNWALLGNFGFLSSIYPCDKACGERPIYPRFPEWLGKYSTQRKTQRELREFRVAIAKSISGSRFAVKFDYVPVLLSRIIRLLKKQTDESVEKVLDLMESYGINPSHIKEHMNDLMYPKKDYYSEVPPLVKAKLTRSYNKRFNDDSTNIKGENARPKGVKKDVEPKQPRYDKNLDDVVYPEEEMDLENKKISEEDEGNQKLEMEEEGVTKKAVNRSSKMVLIKGDGKKKKLKSKAAAPGKQSKRRAANNSSSDDEDDFYDDSFINDDEDDD